MIDLWKSRRDMYLECDYWLQDENENYVENNEIVHKKLPVGHFTAKEIAAYSRDSQFLGETFAAPQETITLLTHDKLFGLRENDIVRIRPNEKIYRVDSIQRVPEKKQRFFLQSGYSNSHYIMLRG